jgi:excisionase family DNA binding protein
MTSDVAAAVKAGLNAAPHTDSSTDVWTAPDLARYLRLSKNCVYAMLARGEIPGQFRFGRSWRVSRLAFLRAFHGQVEPGEADCNAVPAP